MKNDPDSSRYHRINVLPSRFMIIVLILILVFVHSSLFSQCSEFYGMTARGGPNNTGTLFKTGIKGEGFSSYSPSPTAGGIYPKSSLIMASNGKLYGTTFEGGAYNMGTIFEWDPIKNTFVKWIDFDGASKGRHPRGSLFQASNGKFYGMTYEGGADDFGVIFEWDLATNTFIKKFDFRYYIKSENDSIQVGRNPIGSLMEASNGKFYGMTYSGGSNDKGVLFEWDPAGDTYTKKFDFDGINGRNPCGSLMEAANGKIYGVALGGKFDRGVIFEWDVHTNALEKKVDFSDNGSDPVGTLVEAINGKFYGITRHGGSFGHGSSRGGWTSYGTLFEWDPVNDTCIKKIDFDWEISDDHCHSIMMASNGKLYGMGSKRGPAQGYYNNFSNGIIYEWDPVNELYSKKINFTVMSEGRFPYGLLVEANDGKLYGITNSGGESNYGVIFQWNPVTNLYTKLLDFYDAVSSFWPGGSLLHANNGKLYGMTSYGGAYDKGVIFEFDQLQGTFVNRLNFNGMGNGSHPEGSLIQASDGKLYGMTRLGGVYDLGVFFEWDPVS